MARYDLEMSNILDYQLEDSVVADRPDQLKALADPLRSHILDLVLERAMSVTDLAATLGRPKSTVAHHVDVLVDAGLLAVVRTRQVRAVTERFYGRTGRTIIITHDGADRADGTDEAEPLPFVREAEREVDREVWKALGASTFTLRHARIPIERAAEFAERALALAVEFTELPRDGDLEFGFLVGLYPTTRRTVRPAEPAAPALPAAPRADKPKKTKKGKKKRPKATNPHVDVDVDVDDRVP
jgi:DNA-binding transcriptional ArsR family regulator